MAVFRKNMLKALNIKEADMVRPSKQQQPLFPEKWEGTIDRAQFLKKASTQTTSREIMLFIGKPKGRSMMISEYNVEIFQEVAVEWNCRRD